MPWQSHGHTASHFQVIINKWTVPCHRSHHNTIFTRHGYCIPWLWMRRMHALFCKHSSNGYICLYNNSPSFSLPINLSPYSNIAREIVCNSCKKILTYNSVRKWFCLRFWTYPSAYKAAKWNIHRKLYGKKHKKGRIFRPSFLF